MCDSRRRNLLEAIISTIIILVFSGLFVGCGEETEATICRPGELQTCPCLGGGEAVQECTEDRQGWGVCQCDEGDGTIEDAEVADVDVPDLGVADGRVSDSDVVDDGDAALGPDDGGQQDGDVPRREMITIWAHTFNGTLGPGTGTQPGDMRTEGEQGFTDGGSWFSTGGWLSKTISTIGTSNIEVGYLLTKDATSACELDFSIDGGNTWTNVVSDSGAGGYRVDATLPRAAEGEGQVVIRWSAVTAWCWINNITITAWAPVGNDDGARVDEGEMMGASDAIAAGPTFHIFLLMGQSNMVGSDIITAADRVTDERVSVLGYETCPSSNRVSNQWAVASPPLHNCSAGIGPGDYFAKTLADALPAGHTIGLVPTAVSGQWIETFLQGGIHHQNILDKIQIAAGAENARFSGIIFHQGESNNGDATWPGKVLDLYNQVKAAMAIDYDIPFIAGEMLHGGNCEGHNALVRQVPSLGSNFDYVSAEGLVMAPGDEWRVHFDHDSQVTLGRRYGEKMRIALGW